MRGNTASIYGSSDDYYYIDWQLDSQSITNNTSRINWQAKFHYDNTDAQLDNGNASLSGSRWDENGRVRNYGGYFAVRSVTLKTGSFTINHRSDGTQTLSVSGGITVYQSGRSSGSKSWSLPTIPRNSQVDTGSSSYTLGNAMYIDTNRKSSSFTHTIKIRKDNSSGTLIKQINSVGSGVTWTPTSGEISTMESLIPTSNTLKLYINSYNNQVKDDSWVYVNHYLKNANPTFTNFTYKDSDSATVAITGDDQVLVKGKSTLEVKIPAADKMVAIKSATASKYALIYDGTTIQKTYAASGDVVDTFSTISTVGSRTIQVGAYDSRGNNTTVAKNVLVYDYKEPVIEASIEREGNFGANVTIQTSGTFDLLPINGTNKNSLVTSTFEYRYREVGAPTWGSWAVIGYTVTDNTFSGTDKFLSLDNTKQYEFEFHISDQFGAVTQTATLGTGQPIMFIGEDSDTPAVGVGKLPTDGMLDVAGDIYSNGAKLLSFGDIYKATLTKTSTQDTGTGGGIGTISFESVQEYRGTTQTSISDNWWVAPTDGWVTGSITLSIGNGDATDDTNNYGFYESGVGWIYKVSDNWRYQTGSGKEMVTTMTVGFSVTEGMKIKAVFDGISARSIEVLPNSYMTIDFIANPTS